MVDLTLDHIKSLQGETTLVGSKSLTNRTLLLASLGSNPIVLKNILRSDDSEVMLNALQKLQVKYTIDEKDPTCITIQGCNGVFPYSTQKNTEVLELFLGNAGTAMRPLCAALALSAGTYRLVGENRMYERPIGELVDALRQLGAKITYLQNEGYPPLLIEGRLNFINQEQNNQEEKDITPYTLEVRGDTSSQFISALLMVGCMLDKELQVKVKGELISKPYVNLTCELLKQFGIQITNHDFTSFSVLPSKIQSPSTYLVEGDASGATYFLAGAAIQGHVKVFGVGKNSLQGDTNFVKILEKMGAKINIADDFIEVESTNQLHGIDIDMNDMPDAAMTLVPMAVFCDGPIVIRNIASWKVKETDRILAMQTEMLKLKCHVETSNDHILIDANTAEFQAYKDSKEVPCFDTYNDHRMAMCMSLIALDRTIKINDPDCCKKTFPDYFQRLNKLSQY